MRFNLPTVGAALLLAVPASAQAQLPDTIRLRELVVTATRTPVDVANAPGSVTVVTGEAMRERGQRYVVDALRTVPGVTIAQSSGPGSLTSVFMRGGESDYVQVLVDGVQVNDPGGAFEWTHLRAEDIERIEVVRGPASVLYGSDAVSGVVQIFTRAGGTPRLEASLTSARGDKRGAPEGGAYDTHAFDASLAGATAVRSATIQYGASGGYTRSNGLFEYNSDYDNAVAAARIAVGHTRADAAVTARYTEREYHYPTNGGGVVADINQFASGDTRTFGIDAGFRIARAVELRVLGAHHDVATRTDDPADDETDGVFWSTADQLRRSVDARVNVTLPRSVLLTVGAEREWQEAQTAYESASSFGTFGEETDDSRRNTGWYAQVHATTGDLLAFTFGARIDDNERFGTFRTGRAAMNIKPTPATRVHVAAGTAFKEPTFFENFATGFTRGNPGLEPEESRSFEAGVEQAFAAGALTLGVTAFEQRFRNLIQYTAAPAEGAPNYHNVGRARSRGIEAMASAARGRAGVNASYTWTSARVLDAGFGEDRAFEEGRRLLRRPEHQAALDATLALTPAARLIAGVRYVGERDDLDFTDPSEWAGIRTTLAAYAVTDAAIIWTPPVQGRPLELTVGARNLFDADYHEINNFPTPGRVLHVGLRARIGL